MIDVTANWAALSSALLALLVVRSAIPPRRLLVDRIEPYLGIGRARLGTRARSSRLRRIVIAEDQSALRGVFGPTVSQLATSLSRLIDAADNEVLERRLRQAGHDAPDLAQYRMRQLASAVVGCVAGVVVGAAIFGVGIGSLAMFICFSIAGLSMRRGALDRAISTRCALMQAEVPVVAQLLAVHLRTGHGPVESVRSVVLRGKGPVASDCRNALGLVAGGMPPQTAYENLARDCAEPSATRLYRLLASSVRTGGDIVDPLLAVANEARDEQREALARRSVKRRTAMIVPLLLLVAPVMALFVAAALPSLVFGQY